MNQIQNNIVEEAVLKFSNANVKLKKLYSVKSLQPYLIPDKKIYSFDLSAGKTCSQAKICHSYAVETKDGLRIKDGKYTQWRCYAASAEVVYKNVYQLRKHNTELIKNKLSLGVNGLADYISSCIPSKAGIIRIHSSGDFVNKDYFAAWLKVIEDNKDRLFYAYTKQIKFWVDFKDRVDKLTNFCLTGSFGGKQDDLITKYGLRSVKVVYSHKEAKDLGLKLDKDDNFAANPKLRNQNFSLLIHGPMPKGSEAGIAIQKLKKKEMVGYKKSLQKQHQKERCND